MIALLLLALLALPQDERPLTLAPDEVGPRQPGLSLRLYAVEHGPARVPRLVAGQTPNVSVVIPTVDLATGDFGLDERFVTRVSGFLEVRAAGRHAFHLTSDDGSVLRLGGRVVIDHDGLHDASEPAAGEVDLAPGLVPLELDHFESAGYEVLRLEWRPPGADAFAPLPPDVLSTPAGEVRVTSPGTKEVVPALPRGRPGDREPLAALHPSLALADLRPPGFEPRVGGLDFLSDGRLVLCTWDAEGAVWILDGVDWDEPDVRARRFAAGLAEPLGLAVVEDRVFVLQKQELTELIDHDGDGEADEYRAVCADWNVSANFHEFAFGLLHHDGAFWAALAIAIDPGGRSTDPQVPGRGTCLRIPPHGRSEVMARGLRTPNGIGLGPGGSVLVTDNQGDWVPVSKLVRIEPGSFHGSRAVLGEAAAELEVTPPVAWLPQNEIGNSPSQPVTCRFGPWEGHVLVGDVTHGGIKRIVVEEVDGVAQGAVFRFTQGLEAGVNRLCFGPTLPGRGEPRLYVGGIGSKGNWGQEGKLWYGLQRIEHTGAPTFELLAVRPLANGLEVELTEPLAPGWGWDDQDWWVERWRYEATSSYGGPKLDAEQLPVRTASVSPDRRRVFLEVAGVLPGHVVYLRLLGHVPSESGRELWSPECWLTVNALPERRGEVLASALRPVANRLTESQRAEGWELLFDGRTLDGWRSWRGGEIEGWEVVDGALARTGPGGDLVSERIFRDFELELEWRIAQGGNSGIFFHVADGHDHVWETGPEMQVLDSETHPDGLDARTSAGANYALHAPPFDAAKPVGTWNRARLTVRGGHVTHWLNGHRLLDYELESPEWEALVARSKFASMPAYGRAGEGRLALQDHGDRVEFRDVRVREPR